MNGLFQRHCGATELVVTRLKRWREWTLHELRGCVMRVTARSASFCHLHVLGHADLAVHGDGFGQELAGLVAVTGGVAVDEHAGVPWHKP
jgi:hypothetical protein